MSEPLRVERDGGVLTLTNDDPPINRMSFEYMDAVERAVQEAAGDPGVRVLVFTAAGDRNFSVGMDLKQLATGAGARGGLEAVLDQRLRVLSAIESLPKPSIATLFGYCLGGGLEPRRRACRRETLRGDEGPGGGHARLPGEAPARVHGRVSASTVAAVRLSG